MAARTYQNFDLLLEAAAEGEFRARVTGSPLGEGSSGRFALPFADTELEILLLKLDPGRSGTRRSSVDPQQQAAMDLGGALFESVFAGDIMLAWQRSQDAARTQGDGLRLRLRLTDAPSIAGLPWELLYDRRGNSYLAQSERTPVVRYLEVPQPPRSVADPHRDLVAHRPTGARRGGRVATGSGRSRGSGRRGPGEDRPARHTDGRGAVRMAASGRGAHPALHRSR
jgi:hypothetical protein